MDCVRGQIMRSLKGHDKGDFQVVLKTDGVYAYMADGKRRRMEAPKKKKLMHLAPTATVLSEESLRPIDKYARRSQHTERTQRNI